MTRVGIFSSTRADLFPLRPVIIALRDHPDLSPCLLMTGTHHQGSSRHDAEDLGVEVVDLPTDFSSTEPVNLMAAGGQIGSGVARSVAARGLCALVVLGDRWELLPACTAALLLGVPIIHLHGGEVTEGAIDDRVRAAVTKLADLHLCATEDAATRIRALGEPPDRVVVCGAPGLDNFVGASPMPDLELGRLLGRPLVRPLILTTYHPETVDRSAVAATARLVVEAASAGGGTVLVTHPGADPNAEQVVHEIAEAGRRLPNVVVRPHLGSDYASVLAASDLVLGNSSSGIIEAASFHLPVVNVGARQKGRRRGPNVIDVDRPDPMTVAAAVARALSDDFGSICRATANPYGDGRAGDRMAAAIADFCSLPVSENSGSR